MRPLMGTQNSAGMVAGYGCLRPKAGGRKASPGGNGIVVAAAVILGFAGPALAQKSPPPTPSSQSSSQSSATLQQAEALIQQGELNQAKAKVQEELAKHPSSVEGYNLLGIIASSEQDYAGAIAAFQQALKVTPNSAKTHVNLGNVYVAEKKFDLAEKGRQLQPRCSVDGKGRSGGGNSALSAGAADDGRDPIQPRAGLPQNKCHRGSVAIGVAAFGGEQRRSSAPFLSRVDACF
jgi:Tetratricopeptide repeat